MDKQHKEVLIALRKKIIADLDVNNGIINSLTTKFVLRNEDVEKIKYGQSKERRAEILLDILPSCGPYAFEVFHDALAYHYSWLSNDIDKMLSKRSIEISDVTERRASPSPPSLPPQPSVHIDRTEKMKQLKEAMKSIEPGGYLALHGMKGFGKSCLTADTLSDAALVKTLFANRVYWIKFGYERSIDDEILIQLNFLYHQVRNTDAMGTNVHTEPLKDQLIHALKNHFNKEQNRNALLILDDVWSRTIIDAFDFHCKTLVITTNSDFVTGKSRKIIEMKDGFTEAESLGLFAKVLKIQVSELPPEARKMHEECKGMPILISMFAAQFGEFGDDMKSNQERWKYYLDCLRTKDSTNKVIEQFLSKQKATFDMCINQLKPDAQSKYKALAIFSADVNIMPETLEILWGIDRFAAEEQMVDFCHKSLAAKHWNVDLKSYVYGVHDLLLCHLRKKIGAKRLRALHKSFIEKYRVYCKDDFSKLPDDNYSYSYIGHHLEQAKLNKEFPKLYLNFDFIREKIYHTGLSDLLIDLKKYRDFIISEGNENRANVTDLEKFLESYAGIISEQRRRRCLDLVQIGMNYTTEKYVHKKSHEFAKAKTSKLFVTHEGPTFTMSMSGEIPTEARTAFFTDDSNKILIGNYSGQVILWDCKTRFQTVFSGSGEKSVIHKIIISNKGNYFLALNDRGDIQLYTLSEDDYNGTIQTPCSKQGFWNDLFRNGGSRDNSKAKFSVKNETITDMALSQIQSRRNRSDRIGACTDKGTIMVWTTVGDILWKSDHSDEMFQRIDFTRDGSMIHLLNSVGVLTFYAEQIDDSQTKLYTYLAAYNSKIESQKVIFFQAVPHNQRMIFLVTETVAYSIVWNVVCAATNPNCIYQVHSFSRQSRGQTDNVETQFTSAALTHDGQYLITADSKGSINVWCVEFGLGTEPIATFNGRVYSLDTYWQDKDFHLICGCGINTIHRWTLALEELPKSVRKPLFDASMKPWGEENIIAKEVNTSADTTTVNLYCGDATIAKSGPVDGNIIRLSLNSEGDKIVYATDKWVITLFDTQTLKSTPILMTTSAPSIVTFVTVGGSTSVVCGETNNLKTWYMPAGGKMQNFLVDTGTVTSIYTIEPEYVVTIARNGTIICWRVYGNNWSRINVVKACGEDENLYYSSMSTAQDTLAVLKVNGMMIIYKIITNELTTPTTVGMAEYVKYPFNQKLTCCEFSKDDNYLAIGLENGNISIFDVTEKRELNRLELHCNEVRELHWAPTSIGSLILLSVNCDELAWWNVSLLLNDKKKEKTRPSRTGMLHSVSNFELSPTPSARLMQSRSVGSEMKDMANQLETLPIESRNGGEQSIENGRENDKNGHFNPVAYWKDKTAKFPDRPALLTVVPLPPSCNSKVCISSDFSQILSIDIHGIVNKFNFYNYDI